VLGNPQAGRTFTQKGRAHQVRRLSAYETSVSNTIDTLRDGMSFPGCCGEMRI
jgi:hypothetical protein